MNIIRCMVISVALSLFAFTPISYALTTLSTDLTADDRFDMYLSTNESVLGTLIGQSGGDYWDWTTPHNFNFNLAPGVTNYLHIKAWDASGSIAALLGDFTLSNSDYYFDNGTQYLLTNTGNWRVYTDSFGGTLGTVTVANGNNGVSPWGTIPTIDSNATWIWTNNGHDLTTRYFSTTITPVPEPASMALFGLGLFGFGVVSRRKRRF